MHKDHKERFFIQMCRTKIFMLFTGLMLFSLWQGNTTLSAETTTEARTVTLTFTYIRQFAQSSNQFAVWIEDSQKHHVKTIFVTDFTSKEGWKKQKGVLPDWVESADPEDMKTDEIDAVSGPTPDQGELSYTWDCTNQDGNPVPDGDYHFFVEGATGWRSRILQKGTITIGNTKDRATSWARYFGNNEKGHSMIGRVKAEFIP